MIGVKEGPRAEAGRPSGFRGTPNPVQLSLEDVNSYKGRGGRLKINKVDNILEGKKENKSEESKGEKRTDKGNSRN